MLYDDRMRTFKPWLPSNFPLPLVAGMLWLLTVCLVGCDRGGSSRPVTAASLLAGEDVVFMDQVQSNRRDDGAIGELSFVDADGNPLSLEQYRGRKNVLLVFTRGFSGKLCPYCTTQTSRLIANYEAFTARDTEILLVYPGSKAQLPMFMEASVDASGRQQFPFPVLLDEDLAAVNRLGIAAELAYPSTFILDKQGQVRLSYVGANPADRPSIKALLAQLDALTEG
jgi:peroxiredoxin